MELSGNVQFNFPFQSLRVLPFQLFSGVDNMAIDLTLADSVSDDGVPILRFYGWKPFCLSLGHHQRNDYIDTKLLSEKGFDIVRRPTGGSAILHAEELTYSFIIPRKGYSHYDMYSLLHRLLANALTSLGFNVEISQQKHDGSYLNQGNDTFACFNRAAKYEIKYAGKKLVGSAQKILKDTILQHGSIIFDKSHESIVEFLNINAAEKKEQLKILQQNAISLGEISTKTIEPVLLSEQLITEFEKSNLLNIYYKYPTSEELEKITDYQKEVLLT